MDLCDLSAVPASIKLVQANKLIFVIVLIPPLSSDTSRSITSSFLSDSQTVLVWRLSQRAAPSLSQITSFSFSIKFRTLLVCLVSTHAVGALSELITSLQPCLGDIVYSLDEGLLRSYMVNICYFQEQVNKSKFLHFNYHQNEVYYFICLI